MSPLFARRLFLGFGLFVVCSASRGCGCSGTENEVTINLPQEIKDYLVFPQGSYWVYKEATTDAIDTVSFYEGGLRIIRGPSGFDYEEFWNNAASSLRKDTIYGMVRPSFGEPQMHIYRWRHRLAFAGGNSIVCSFNSKPEGYVFDYGEATSTAVKYESYLDSLQVQGVYYQQVKVFSQQTAVDSFYPTKHYFAKQVGIIRKEYANGQVWELTARRTQ